MSDSDPELVSEEGQDVKESLGDSGIVIRFEDLLDDHDVFVEVPGKLQLQSPTCSFAPRSSPNAQTVRICWKMR